MADTKQTVSPTPLFLGAALLFWGWRVEFLPLALAMAITLESARFVSLRWQFSDKDVNRLVDLSSVIVLVVAVYMYATRAAAGFFVVAQWLPALVFLIVGAQIYSSQGTLPLSSLFITLRRKKPKQDTKLEGRVDIRFPYVAVCMLAASMVAVRTPWFYAGICALAAWGLWGFRPRRYRVITWGGLLLSVFALGYAGHVGLNRLQGVVVEMVVEWMVWSDKDPYQSTTAMGHIGSLKISERILLRVELPPEANGNLLLRQASYDSYASETWRAANGQFEQVAEDSTPGTWRLGESELHDGAVIVSGRLRRGRGILALPNGSSRIENLPAEYLNRNPYGAIKVENAPGLVSYSARYNSDVSFDLRPTERDLYVPNRYESVLGEIVSDLELSKEDPNAALAALRRYFRENFSYSLVKENDTEYAPLSEFLLISQSGHCEYFATATALLLRSAGIPARYATGYSVQEYSDLDKMYIVRQRHAHAWVLAYIDGAWRDVDFTPPAWFSLEEQTAPWWQRVYDLSSHIGFLFSSWRWGERDTQSVDVLIWMLMPLGLFLGWRLYLQQRIRRGRLMKDRDSPARAGSDCDSAFSRIINYLASLDRPRRSGETLSQWVRRITDGDVFVVDKDTLLTALALHYRIRFDPQGLTPDDRKRLESKVSEWIADQPPNMLTDLAGKGIRTPVS